MKLSLFVYVFQHTVSFSHKPTIHGSIVQASQEEVQMNGMEWNISVKWGSFTRRLQSEELLSKKFNYDEPLGEEEGTVPLNLTATVQCCCAAAAADDADEEPLDDQA